MTNYIRFFHAETHRFSFAAIEAAVTAITLLVFVVIPTRHFAFFPNAGFRRFAQRRLRACISIFLLSFLGRIVLLPIEPFRVPNIHDEFSYLLASDTFAHSRVTNPTPPLWHHFEAFYVLMQPTYASKYGAAQPLFMAFGQRFLRTPRAGILLSMALAAASLCWMLQAYVPPEWALLGGLLAVVRISWFSYFGNSYWGGSVAMLGGCLLMGAAARLGCAPHSRDGLLMAMGLLLLANSRPFEGVLISLPICLYTIWVLFHKRVECRIWLPGVVLLFLGAAGTGYYCHRVTGQFTFPWVVYWRQWSICPPFLFGKPNYSVQYQFRDQLVYSRDFELAPYVSSVNRGNLLTGLAVKAIFQWLFFVFPALTPAHIGLIPTLRARKSRILMYTLAFAWPGFFSETWLQAHYVAVTAGAIYLVLLNGLRWMRVRARQNDLWLRLLRGTLASVVIMVFVRLVVVPGDTFPPNWASQTGDIPGYQDISRMMEAKAGKQLVIVRYRPDHFWGYSWINNGYDIPTQHVIWARDTEPEESNIPLLCAFQDRQVWLLVPPERGFIPPPDRTAHWRPAGAEQFFKPYPMSASKACYSESIAPW
ncbi:MAG TPA: hypothetical protein VMB49_09180 [Acidobacteriaceae bacterium]|nr:hypothetical protein [Acidobacteriaceae bacterium]